MGVKYKTGCLLSAFASVLLTNAGAQSKDLTLDGSFQFYSGDYGTAQKTNITYIPVKLTRTFSSGDASVTVPYVSITGHGNVTFVTGPVRNQKVHTNETETTESGLGDIFLRGRLFLAPEGDFNPDVTLGAFVKLPTADENKGLGTGEFDEGLTLELLKTFTPKYFGTLDLGYTWTGDPPNIDYNDRWYAGVGGGYRLTTDMSITLMYEEERAILPGEVNVRDVATYLNISTRSGASVYAELEIGLSNEAPDTGFILGGRVKF